ncbi:MAG: hypothetical protein WBQ21_11495 [Solirubrobacteraceae bacterium]
MSDVLERLRAANPVSDSPQPDLLDFRRTFEERCAVGSSPFRTRTRGASRWRGALRPTRSGWMAVTAALVVVLTVVVTLSRGGAGISLVQRAYAATDPAGGIVYYATSTRLTIGSGGRSSTVESRAQVWRSGSRSRRVETAETRTREGRPARRGSYEQATERVARGETNNSYSSIGNTVFKGFLAFSGSVSPESVNCRLAPVCSLTTEDPVLALRELYAAGRVREVGHTRLNGATLTVLEADSVLRTQPAPLHFIRLSPSTRILIDPKTGAPVELTTRYGRQPRALTTTTIFHKYQHLKLTPQTEQLLRFKSHPHARVECVPALHCPLKQTVK